jgi:hypothetical protein
MKLTKEELKTKIRNTKGSFFTLKFIKADGSTRIANCKAFDKASIKGTGSERVKKSPCVPVWDRNKKNWVNVYPDKVLEMSCGKRESFHV